MIPTAVKGAVSRCNYLAVNARISKREFNGRSAAGHADTVASVKEGRELAFEEADFFAQDEACAIQQGIDPGLPLRTGGLQGEFQIGCRNGRESG